MLRLWAMFSEEEEGWGYVQIDPCGTMPHRPMQLPLNFVHNFDSSNIPQKFHFWKENLTGKCWLTLDNSLKQLKTPNLVLWSTTLCSVYFILLTLLWEDTTDEASERKRLQYIDLKTEVEQQGWRATIYPVEVGCQGVIATSTITLLKQLEMRGQALRRTIKVISGTTERCSHWLWIKRKDSVRCV